MDNQALAEAVFEALGEPTRRRIVELLAEGPVQVSDLANRLPVGRPAVSRHLKVLAGAGLVSYRTSGTRNLYSLAPEGLAAAQQWLVRTWDLVLAAFAAEVDRAQPVAHPTKELS
jgi:DNA-binding transcriptional ArsR family regulator